MTNTHPTSPEREDVVLVRVGVKPQRFVLSPGSTVADLLREAGAERRNQDIMIEDRQLEEADVLESGSVIYLVPRIRNALVEFVEDETLSPAGLTEAELRQEIAIVLFQRDRLTLAQASHFAGLDRLQFQRLLASRQIPIHYDVDDLEADLTTLRELGRR